MSSRKYIKWMCALLISCLLIGIMIGFITAHSIAHKEYKTTASLLGASLRVNPDLDQVIIQGIKEGSSKDFALGDKILRTYGYSPEFLSSRNLSPMVWIGSLLMLLIGFLILSIGFIYIRRKTNRIKGLTTYLEQVNLGQESLLTRQEDDFSYLEDEIYKTVTSLRQMSENALQERKKLADNLADISHQLKTPITSMSLMTQLLADKNDAENTLYIGKLENQIARLEQLVSSLLTLSKLDAGTLQLERKPVNIYSMLSRAAEPMEEVLLQKGQQLVIRPESDLYFLGDISWSAEAFLNIIKNCSEHTPDGNLITISYSQNPIHSEIIVKDNGTGFDSEDLPHLFERFYKGKNANKDSVGIGLALSKSIICLQNGTIHAENSSDGSAQFIVKFYK
ncbi:MAG TPA: HAMP domain-containing sensor histidine kinase [Lachnospiraceae bacterium]|nr:HAMP domain-containing sensor histidine kinase [Lachnospiraceae bacterium]